MIRGFASVRHSFPALQKRNFRFYAFGHLLSSTGTWLHTVALSWLVFSLSGNGLTVGTVMGLQFLPMVLAGPWGGLLADRVDRHRALLKSQILLAVIAAILTSVVASGVVELWVIYVAALSTGCVAAVDLPLRQSFVAEMVDTDTLPNAIALNGVIYSTARVVGPAVAGFLIATVGIWPCFLLNGFSYLATVAALQFIRSEELHGRPPVLRGRGQIREGIRYVWLSRERRTLIFSMGLIGTTALNFQVVLPLLARYTFETDGAGFGMMNTVFGIGSLLGALVAASLAPSPIKLIISSMVTAVMFLGIVVAPTFGMALALLIPLGAALIYFVVSVNSLLQLCTEESMRGRVTSLYVLVFVGSTPVGAPIVGYLSEQAGPRSGLVLASFGMSMAAILLVHGLGIRIFKNDDAIAPNTANA